MAKRHLTQYDSEGRKIPIYLEANEVDMNGRPLDEVIGEGVYDPQYVHTDNNYTTAEKNKLAGLRNYDDTDVQTAIRNINDAIDRLTGTSDTTEIIDTMNEVIDFLSGLDNTDSLANELVSIRQQLANKLNAGDAYNKQEVDDLLNVKQDIINDLVTIRNGARLGATAVQTETDPTVPSWAKQPRKPTYTAAEVGALPANTTIPQGTVTAVKVNDGQPVYPNSSGVVSITISASGAQVQPDWNETNTESPAYIQNKPNVANAISVNQHSYVMNDHHAFVIPDYYTKTETDNAIANAVEGLGGGSVESVTINGQTKTPDSQGNVDLGTIQGQPGAQGPAGNTYLVDENFDPVSMIINNLDESDGTVALSARQGKILKQNVEALWAKVNTLIRDLAAMAFTDTKTQGLGNIDWTGGTFYATIVKSLTGCTATDNTTNGQIAEGSTLTMQLTASSGYTLTGATISVTNSKGQSVAYTLNGSTLTVANVTGTINISVVAVAIYSVANNDTHATLSNSTPTNPTHGSSWSGTLSAAIGYGLAATPQVTMGGVAVDFTATGNSWNRSTGVMTIGNVTGNIVILEAAVEVVAHTVTKKLLNMTSSNTTGDTTDPDFGYKMQSVEDGDSYSTTLAAVSGATSNNDVVVKMGGVDITSTAYNSSTGAVNIAEVTGDVTIIATAHTGNVTAKANASGTTLTINHGGISSTLTCDTDNGDGTFSGSANIGDDAITKLSFSDKSAFLSFDFGGSVATSLGNVGRFGAFSTADACSSLTSIKGLVLQQNNLEAIVAYCPLTDIDTIGWGLNGVSSLYNAFSRTNLTSLDIEDFDVLQGCTVRQLVNGSSALSRIKLPHMPYIDTLNTTFRGTALTNIVISAGSGITSIENCFGDCINLSLVDISDVIITSSLATISFAFNGAKSGITLKIGEFDMSGVTTSTVHSMNKITNLICTTTTPQNSAMFTYLTSLTAIYVPDAVAGNYKSAWSDKAGIIYPISEYTE